MAEIFRDGFNGTPGDDLTTYNPSWVRQAGIVAPLVIDPEGSAATGTATTSTAAYYRSDVIAPSPDYLVSADISVIARLINASAVGVINRAASDSITHYQFRFLSSSNAPNGTWQLRRIINNSAATLTSLAGTWDAGEIHNLQIATSGSQVSAYLDKGTTPFLGPVSSTISDRGFGGILGTNVPDTRVRIDNFVIDNGLAGGQPGNATVVGVAGVPAAGVVLASGSSSALLNGVRANPAAVSVSASGSAAASVLGSAGAPSSGIVIASGASAAEIIGVSAEAKAAVVNASGSAIELVTGVAANPAAGLISAGSGGAASVIGVAANPRIAELVAFGSASEVIIGVSANPTVGIVIAEAGHEQGEDIDALLVPPRQTVEFEGSIRVVVFEGSNRVVSFEGSKRLVEFP